MQYLRQGESRVDTGRVLTNGIKGVDFKVKDSSPRGDINSTHHVMPVVGSIKTQTEITSDENPHGRVPVCNKPRLTRPGFKASQMRVQVDGKWNYLRRGGKEGVDSCTGTALVGARTPRVVYYPTIVTHKPMTPHDERGKGMLRRHEAKSPRKLENAATETPTSVIRQHDDIKPSSALIQPATLDGDDARRKLNTVFSHSPPKSRDPSENIQRMDRRNSEGGPNGSEMQQTKSLSKFTENGRNSPDNNPKRYRNEMQINRQENEVESEQDCRGGQIPASALPDKDGEGGLVKQPTEFTDDMSHYSFMEASLRNIAETRNAMSKARQRLDRSVSVDYGRPNTVPSFPTVIAATNERKDVNKPVDKKEEQGKDVGTTRRRSQSVSDIQTSGTGRLNQPARIASWRPSEALSTRGQGIPSGKVDEPVKEKNSLGVESTGELPLLTGKNQYVYFKPGVVFFEGDSANLYYNSLFRLVRRSVGSVYKHNEDKIDN